MGITKLKGERFIVTSNSRPGVAYTINAAIPSCMGSDGKPCPAFYWRGGCRHLREVAEFRERTKT